MASCLRRTRTAIAIFKAIISRALFALHGFICIWRVTVIKGQPLYWCLTGTIPILIVETVFTIKMKRGGEWKWLCPSVLLYLGTAVPAIWFLELDLMWLRINSKSSPATYNVSQEDAISSVLNGKLRISISLGREEWCKVLEQMLLLLLIIGRWLLPKGEITREQLSQLLLVYIGHGGRLIELFEASQGTTEDGVRENYMLTLIILALWTASLTQFTFVLTATKAKRMRPVLYHSDSATSAISIAGKSCCPTEVLSIVISMLLQDGPFLVLRMLLIFRYEVLSYTNLFFTSKNTLVLVLQIYRLLVLFSHKRKEEGRARAKAALLLTHSEPGAGSGERGAAGSRPGSADLLRGRRVRKEKPYGDGEDVADDEGATSDDEDVEEIEDGRGGHGGVVPVRSPTSARRESFKRQQKAVAESSLTSTEREDLDGGDARSKKHPTSATPTSSHGSPHHLSSPDKRLKSKGGPGPGRRRPSEDSTRGSMSDSREDVRNKIRPAGGGGGGGGKKGGNIPRRQRSAKEHWQDVRHLTKSIAFVSEAGKYKTLVLKPVDTIDNQTVYVVESEHLGDASCL